jgi:hypothetical protein
MSWKMINQILGLALADSEFWQELQHDPLAAVQKQGFELTAEEKEVFCKASTADLTLFSQYLLARLDPPETKREKYGQE